MMFKGLFAAGVIALLLLASGTPEASAGKEHSHPGGSAEPALGASPGRASRYSLEQTRQGRVWAIEAQEYDGEYPFLLFLEQENGERVGLYGDMAERLSVGDEVTITGRFATPARHFGAALHGDILVERVVMSKGSREGSRFEPRVERLGRQGFILAFLSWPGFPQSRTHLSDAPRARDLTSWSLAASDGRFAWDPVETVEVALDSPLAPCVSGAEPPVDSWSRVVKQELAAMGYDLPKDFDALGLAFPEGASICVPQAAAYAFYSDRCKFGDSGQCGLSIYNPGATSFGILVHELGHSLGLPHANSASCTSAGTPVSFGYTQMACTNLEYFDGFDPMGFAPRNTANGFNPAFADELGWIETNDLAQIPIWGNVDQEINLSPYGGTTGTRAIQAFLPQIQTPMGMGIPGKVYFEYRARTGLDQALWGGVAEGWMCPDGGANSLFLRVVPSAAGYQAIGLTPPTSLTTIGPSLLIDTDLETAAPSFGWLCDAGLVPGESWEDPSGKLRVDFVARSPDLSGATVRVRSQGIVGEGSFVQVETIGDGRGRVVSEPTGVDCSGRCTSALGSTSRIRLRAIPARGSAFGQWGTGDCSRFFSNRVCNLDFDGQRKAVSAGFVVDPDQTVSDIELLDFRVRPGKARVRAGKKLWIRVSLRNVGLDPGPVSVKTSSSRSRIAKVPKSIRFTVPGRSTASRKFRVLTKEGRRGRAVITLRFGAERQRVPVRIVK